MSSKLQNIVIPYAPRPLQRELHDKMDAKRWGVVVCHRRFGKTVWAINHILRDAILSRKVNPRYAYMAPTYRQAKNVAWDWEVGVGVVGGDMDGVDEDWVDDDHFGEQ